MYRYASKRINSSWHMYRMAGCFKTNQDLLVSMQCVRINIVGSIDIACPWKGRAASIFGMYFGCIQVIQQFYNMYHRLSVIYLPFSAAFGDIWGCWICWQMISPRNRPSLFCGAWQRRTRLFSGLALLDFLYLPAFVEMENAAIP